MKQEINADKPLTEEQARDYLERLKKGDLSIFTDRIWARQSTKEDRLKKRNKFRGSPRLREGLDKLLFCVGKIRYCFGSAGFSL